MHDNGYSLSEPFLITQAMQAVKAILTLTLKKVLHLNVRYKSTTNLYVLGKRNPLWDLL